MNDDASHALLARLGSIGLDAPLAATLVEVADRRLRESLRVIGALTGLPVLIVIVILAAGDFNLRGLWALAVAGAVSAGLAFATSAPARQERAFTRRLVRQGRIVSATVTSQGQYWNGRPTLDVAIGAEGRRLRFRLPGAPEEVQAAVGQVLPALVLDDNPDVIGVLVPGFGLVTTR
ncbi:MAG: hypothetical protein IV100_34265 [Myxococcales bacterium]|nr:hypothetical protein [Myxococcales bacterium]